MRNLKKILALVLALVMSLSLMAAAGAGSFQDVTDDNQYKTAIEVLDALKVIKGYGDGTFKPEGTLNRAEAAVLVYRIATGDVDDKYLGNYTDMAQSNFTDLNGYNWARGYINYCQNAKIVVGTSATTFDPGAKVTGYQLLVMVLRTLGYGKAGEFADAKTWELETAKIAERENITKNVVGGDFHSPAPRAMVAEILFRGLLHDTVEYSALTPGGYTNSGVTLGKRELGLEEVEGVITANEFADLYDTEPLPDGKTRLGDYTIEKTTGFDDIGESRLAYLKDGKTVLSIADSGKNAKAESLAEEKNLDRILGEAGIAANGETERFINFGQGTNWTSDWKIKYVLTLGGGFTSADRLSSIDDLTVPEKEAWEAQVEFILDLYADMGFNFNLPYDLEEYDRKYLGTDDNSLFNYELTYTREYKIGADITPYHQQNIEEIFNVADKTHENNYITGEVYVGTTSMKDISDEKSFEQFKTDYIKESDEASVNNNQRGNWLKVIDNDGDGKAEYILKVIYTMAQVSRVKDDKITLDVKDRILIDDASRNGTDPCNDDAVNNLTSQAVTTKDDADYTEPAAGDVVYYAIIDGNAYAYQADMEAASFEKVNRNTRVATTTDGTEWTESQICEHIVDEAYQSNITSIAGKVSYDVYFDRGGYIAAFAKSVGSDFALITDGWFNSTKNNGYEYAVKVYDAEADEQNVVDLNKSASLFISGLVENSYGQVQNNDWDALKYLGGVNESNGANDNDPVGVLNGAENALSNRIKTTVAAISGEDILPVEDASVTGRYLRSMINMDEENAGTKAIPTNTYKTGTVYFTNANSDTAYDAEGAEVEVRALSNTVYYVVYPLSPNSREVGVKSWTGYGNVPSVIKDDMIEDVYTVATRNTADNDLGNDTHYYTANIVVIELNRPYPGGKEVVFLVDDEVSMSNVKNRPVRVIDAEGKEQTVTVVNQPPRSGTLSNSTEDSGVATPKWEPGLYYLEETATKDMYTLDPLTPAEIRDEGFMIGMVQYENVPSDYDYVTVIPADRGVPDGNGNVIDYLPSNTNNGDPYKINKDALWSLGYGVGDYRDYCSDAAEAELGDASWVLRARRDYTNKSAEGEYRDYRISDHEAVNGWYNWNRVLVKYDKDSMVYAISFDNLIGSAGKRADYARRVWFNCAPAAADGVYYTAPAVTFFGVGDTNTAPDLAVNGNEITVSYKTANDAADKRIVVTPVDGNAITRVVANIVGGGEVEMSKEKIDGKDCYVSGALTLSTDADEVYSVTVYYNSDKDTVSHATWTLTQNAQVDTFGELKTKFPADDTANNPAGIQVLTSDVEGGTASINVAKSSGTMLSSLEAMLKTDAETDKVALKAVEAGGATMSHEWLENHTVSEFIATGAKLYAIITNVDGKEKEVEITLTGTDATGDLYTFTDGKGVVSTVEKATANLNVGIDDTTEYYTLTDEDGNYYNAAGAKQAEATYIKVADNGTVTFPDAEVNITVTGGYRAVYYSDDTTNAIAYLKAGEEDVIEDVSWARSGTPNAFVQYKNQAASETGYLQIGSIQDDNGTYTTSINVAEMPDYDIYITSEGLGGGVIAPVCYFGVIVDGDVSKVVAYVGREDTLSMSTVAAAIGATPGTNVYYRIWNAQATGAAGVSDYEYVASNGTSTTKGKNVEKYNDDDALNGYINVETGFYKVTVTNDTNIANITATIKEGYDAAAQVGGLGFIDQTTLTNAHYVKDGNTFTLTAGSAGFNVGTDEYAPNTGVYEKVIDANVTIAIVAYTG